MRRIECFHLQEQQVDNQDMKVVDKGLVDVYTRNESLSTNTLYYIYVTLHGSRHLYRDNPLNNAKQAPLLVTAPPESDTAEYKCNLLFYSELPPSTNEVYV